MLYTENVIRDILVVLTDKGATALLYMQCCIAFLGCMILLGHVYFYFFTYVGPSVWIRLLIEVVLHLCRFSVCPLLETSLGSCICRLNEMFLCLLHLSSVASRREYA